MLVAIPKYCRKKTCTNGISHCYKCKSDILIIKFLMRTGPRVEELVTLEITDLKRNKSNGFFKNCKKKSDGWFSLHPKFSGTLWEFIEEDISGSNYVFHNRY